MMMYQLDVVPLLRALRRLHFLAVPMAAHDKKREERVVRKSNAVWRRG